MIKFFRHIRRSLLSEGKTAKYLKYAIGEILLVVIGILIALGINNWNENLKAQKNEKVLLQKLQEENRLNLDDLNSDYEYRENLDQTLENFNVFLASDSIENQQAKLKNYLADIFRSTSYTFTQTNLINYINLHDDSFSELNKELSELKIMEYDLQTISEKGIDIKINNFFEALKDDVDFNTLHIESFETLKSLGFRNNIVIIQSIESEISYQFNNTINQIKKVDALISSRLNKDEIDSLQTK
ncbi:DUF6090 family protein [Psychroserpens luteolus]|uniref:DUF6090 family protein n=1 Tax=Psychroserpens luteolus TaxID=2855840 RepID=UPI001E41C38C|nr:DUF6090 family protein [Psychroserpens luteolus]MCD2260282.1 hypothetical protein [Psychroserpens luteolus]